jgi:hypothetical protein
VWSHVVNVSLLVIPHERSECRDLPYITRGQL